MCTNNFHTLSAPTPYQQAVEDVLHAPEDLFPEDVQTITQWLPIARKLHEGKALEWWEEYKQALRDEFGMED